MISRDLQQCVGVCRWAYLYLIVYLREKDTTDYNGWEQHVAQMMEAEDVSFFPRNDAIALKEVKQREEAEARARSSTASYDARPVTSFHRCCAPRRAPRPSRRRAARSR